MIMIFFYKNISRYLLWRLLADPKSFVVTTVESRIDGVLPRDQFTGATAVKIQVRFPVLISQRT